MSSLKDAIKEAIQSIDRVTDLLYKWNTSLAYEYLDETFRLLSSTIDQIFQYQVNGHDIGIEVNNIMNILNLAMKAIEEKDTILLADILNYDLKELLKTADTNII